MLAAAAAPTAALAQETEQPHADFLEYLGSWQDEDEEWFVEAEIEPPPAPESGDKRRRGDDEQE